MRNDGMNRAIPFVIAIVGLGTIPGSSSLFGPGAQTNAPVETRPAWAEFVWPFLLDQWGVGRAFVCKAVDCGTEVKVYVRPKIGFCNCTTGVSLFIWDKPAPLDWTFATTAPMRV
jgi:hypothetical protein